MMYSRKQLALKYGLSDSKLRRILKVLLLEPEAVLKNAQGLDTFYYSQKTIDTLNLYLDKVKQKLLHPTKKCCICKKLVPVEQITHNRCPLCYMKKCLSPVVYGKRIWLRVIYKLNVIQAINYLKSLI